MTELQWNIKLKEEVFYVRQIWRTTNSDAEWVEFIIAHTSMTVCIYRLAFHTHTQNARVNQCALYNI